MGKRQSVILAVTIVCSRVAVFGNAFLASRVLQFSQNIDTYLRAVNKEIVQEMIRTFIQEVLVGPTTATLRYTVSMPSGGPGKGAMTEEVALSQST